MVDGERRRDRELRGPGFTLATWWIFTLLVVSIPVSLAMDEPGEWVLVLVALVPALYLAALPVGWLLGIVGRFGARAGSSADEGWLAGLSDAERRVVGAVTAGWLVVAVAMLVLLPWSGLFRRGGPVATAAITAYGVGAVVAALAGAGIRVRWREVRSRELVVAALVPVLLLGGVARLAERVRPVSVVPGMVMTKVLTPDGHGAPSRAQLHTASAMQNVSRSTSGLDFRLKGNGNAVVATSGHGGNIIFRGATLRDWVGVAARADGFGSVSWVGPSSERIPDLHLWDANALAVHRGGSAYLVNWNPAPAPYGGTVEYLVRVCSDRRCTDLSPTTSHTTSVDLDGIEFNDAVGRPQPRGIRSLRAIWTSQDGRRSLHWGSDVLVPAQPPPAAPS